MSSSDVSAWITDLFENSSWEYTGNGCTLKGNTGDGTPFSSLYARHQSSLTRRWSNCVHNQAGPGAVYSTVLDDFATFRSLSSSNTRNFKNLFEKFSHNSAGRCNRQSNNNVTTWIGEAEATLPQKEVAITGTGPYLNDSNGNIGTYSTGLGVPAKRLTNYGQSAVSITSIGQTTQNAGSGDLESNVNLGEGSLDIRKGCASMIGLGTLLSINNQSSGNVRCTSSNGTYIKRHLAASLKSNSSEEDVVKAGVEITSNAGNTVYTSSGDDILPLEKSVWPYRTKSRPAAR